MLTWELISAVGLFDAACARRSRDLSRRTDCRKLVARHADHGQFPDLASSSQVEERQTNDADLFVRRGRSAADESSRILARADLPSSNRQLSPDAN